MEFKELILERRSTRKYAAPVEREALIEILKNAQKAPSWKNLQTSRSYAVLDPEKVAQVRESGLPPFNQKNAANAALIVSTFVKDTVGFTEGVPDNEVGNGWGAYDLGLHDAFLVLAARDAGYDTLIMGIRDSDAIRATLAIPENEQIMSVIAIGKREREPGVRPRKELDEVATII